ncbi:serine/threonine-protein kinase MARK2-like [Rousettus aegyptiacus]|uniref:non-specific serine/threonine protein kinase n=1 Tax=Rousettus aegyptiacus TaxID=9407 RepID=A0A7J8C298_ROUAE|nr:serine/threonine-protein kinase MARK2-like [Rousettus aegyptiacus]KAF6404983.1 hypothetical protein HJG63_009312 [Rousettus aegyptiacus]
MSQDRAASPSDQVARIGHYELLDTIGHGSFAKVRLGRHIPTGTQVAVKVIRWQNTPKLQKLQERELDCMRILDHPNIVKLFEVIDTKRFRFLVMEYVSGGDLFSYLETHGPMTEDQARGPFRQLVSAVQYCHQKGIVHRDLKPENVLFDAQRTVRLADFGLSIQFGDGKLRTLCGTLPYAAPELFLGLEYDGPAVDVWSLGVVLYNMLTTTLPFHGADFWSIRRQIMTGKYEPPKGVSLLGQALLKKLMNLEPAERGSLTEVMPHPWLNKGQEEWLQPYREPPSEDMDPGVMQKMTELGFECERIRDSVKGRKYNSVMATYVMLRAAKHEVKGRTILVQSLHPQDLPSESSGSSSAGDTEAWCTGLSSQRQESGQQAQGPACPPASPASSTATPPPGPESGAATPSPVPSCGPGDSPPAHGTRPSSPGGDDGGEGGGDDGGGGGDDSGEGGGDDSGGGGDDNGEGDGDDGGEGDGDDGGEGDGDDGGGGGGRSGSDRAGTPDIPSGCWRGLARRFLNFVSSKFCFRQSRPRRRRRRKRTRVSPL